MINIRTRYVGPAGATGTRIKVTGQHGQRLIPYDYSARDAHVAAVQQYSATVLGMSTVTVTEYMSSEDGQRRGFTVTDQSRQASMDRHPAGKGRK